MPETRDAVIAYNPVLSGAFCHYKGNNRSSMTGSTETTVNNT